MKTKLFTPLLLILASATSFAQSPSDADEVTKAINAEVQVTNERIANLLSQMGTVKSNPYQDANYASVAEDFKQKVQAAMVRYDSEMKSIILPKAKYWLDRFASTVQSANGNKEFIQLSASGTQHELDILGQEHQTMIAELYTSVLGDFPRTITKSSSRRTARECGLHGQPWDSEKSGKNASRYESVDLTPLSLSGKTNASVWSEICILQTGYNNGLYVVRPAKYSLHGEVRWGDVDAAVAEQKPTLIITELTKVCVSPTCKQLRLADSLQYITLVSDLLDQPESLPTTSGLAFTIPRSNLNMTEIIATLTSISLR